MTRDEFIQRAVISMAGKVVDAAGQLEDREMEYITESAFRLMKATEEFANFDTSKKQKP